MNKAELLSAFALFSGRTGGLDTWIGPETSPLVFDRLGELNVKPLSLVQLNQLLVLGHEAGMSEGCFRYYWLSEPDHSYDITKLPFYDAAHKEQAQITSIDHLRWGLYRIYVDGLLFFGNIRTAYRALRTQTLRELEELHRARRIDTAAIARRGPPLLLHEIGRDNRYLISEMACKSFGNADGAEEVRAALLDSWEEHTKLGGGVVTVKELLSGEFATRKYKTQQLQFSLSIDEIMAEQISSREQLAARVGQVATKYLAARQAALVNTKLYLSMVNDLDVYVATSMRGRDDFRKMADTCRQLFSNEKLRELHLRYFDPTLSAAEGHEDKGLIECLMVKCAKVLIYCAGDKESYGKDAEAAMALSLGKPVIFLCDTQEKARFYREVHPLSRLIHFDTGVAVGAMVAESVDAAAELVFRILNNKMEYELDQPRAGRFRLKERTTDSVVRIQTDDELLRETFWNYYHNLDHREP